MSILSKKGVKFVSPKLIPPPRLNHTKSFVFINFSSKERREQDEQGNRTELFARKTRIQRGDPHYTKRTSAIAPATSARTGRWESAAPGNWIGPVVWAGGDGGAVPVGLGGRGDGRETGGGT